MQVGHARLRSWVHPLSMAAKIVLLGEVHVALDKK
jgi:hypothetical protein